MWSSIHSTPQFAMEKLLPGKSYGRLNNQHTMDLPANLSRLTSSGYHDWGYICCHRNSVSKSIISIQAAHSRM